MNSGILPLILLGLTLGLALSSVMERTAWRGWIIASVTALAISFVPIADQHRLPIEIALWVSVIATAAVVYLPARHAARVIVPVAINAGGWLGAVAAVDIMRPALIAGVLAATSFVVIRALSSIGSAMAVKVVGSWMIAISTLAVFVSMVPTPGYKQDHME